MRSPVCIVTESLLHRTTRVRDGCDVPIGILLGIEPLVEGSGDAAVSEDQVVDVSDSPDELAIGGGG